MTATLGGGAAMSLLTPLPPRIAAARRLRAGDADLAAAAGLRRAAAVVGGAGAERHRRLFRGHRGLHHHRRHGAHRPGHAAGVGERVALLPGVRRRSWASSCSAVAILPLLGVGGSQLFKSETAGPMKDQKLTPRIAETARASVVGVRLHRASLHAAYRAAGMSWTDAFMHMCSTIGLGGFRRLRRQPGPSTRRTSRPSRSSSCCWPASTSRSTSWSGIRARWRRCGTTSRCGRTRGARRRGALVALYLVAFGVLHRPAAGAAPHRLQCRLGRHHHRLRHRGLRHTGRCSRRVLMLFLCSFATCAGVHRRRHQAGPHAAAAQAGAARTDAHRAPAAPWNPVMLGGTVVGDH